MSMALASGSPVVVMNAVFEKLMVHLLIAHRVH